MVQALKELVLKPKSATTGISSNRNLEETIMPNIPPNTPSTMINLRDPDGVSFRSFEAFHLAEMLHCFVFQNIDGPYSQHTREQCFYGTKVYVYCATKKAIEIARGEDWSTYGRKKLEHDDLEHVQSGDILHIETSYYDGKKWIKKRAKIQIHSSNLKHVCICQGVEFNAFSDDLEERRFPINRAPGVDLVEIGIVEWEYHVN
ncbi:hypothetical protein FGB62_298g02 [Gracilaria domingensis]|nr:hypothetical protein FGB62_298g02 [Gracilaria domingensis]